MNNIDLNNLETIEVEGTTFTQALLWKNGELIKLNHIFASRDGRLYRQGHVTEKGYTLKGKMVKQTKHVDKAGRIDYNFKYNHEGKDIRPLVARVIASTFIPNPDPTFTVNHENEDSSCNEIWNLSWMSLKDNLEHSKEKIEDALRIKPVTCMIGETSYLFKNQTAAERVLRSFGATIHQSEISRQLSGMRLKAGTLNGTPIIFEFVDDKKTAGEQLNGQDFIELT